MEKAVPVPQAVVTVADKSGTRFHRVEDVTITDAHLMSTIRAFIEVNNLMAAAPSEPVYVPGSRAPLWPLGLSWRLNVGIT